MEFLMSIVYLTTLLFMAFALSAILRVLHKLGVFEKVKYVMPGRIRRFLQAWIVDAWIEGEE